MNGPGHSQARSTRACGNVTQYPTSSPSSEAATTQSVRLSLERRGRDVAALVSLEDLALLNDLEDRIDLEAAREAVEEYGSVGKR